jgi:hypothetical protein
MKNEHQFVNSHKFKSLEESVRVIVNGLFGTPESGSYDAVEINEKDNEFWVNFHYLMPNETHLTVRCDMHYVGKCASIKQITFLH